jgi:adenine-specific DNA methylase
MSETTSGSGTGTDTGTESHMDIYDRESGDQLACLVCGALVSREKDFARVHWDWHEATNGA